MTLLSFSDKNFIYLLFVGLKKQTTRKERAKNPIKPGDTLQIYFRNRQRKSCHNCISMACPLAGEMKSDHNCTSYGTNAGDKLCYDCNSDCVIPIHVRQAKMYCEHHTHHFGDAEVVSVQSTNFSDLTGAELEQWAKLDGFNTFAHADRWFTKVYGPEWMDDSWDVITFNPDWLKWRGMILHIASWGRYPSAIVDIPIEVALLGAYRAILAKNKAEPTIDLAAYG